MVADGKVPGAVEAFLREKIMPLIVKNPSDILEAYRLDVACFGSIKHYAGAIFGRLLKLFDDRIPEGLVCGRMFKVQQKAVVLFDKRYAFPFDLEEFEKHYVVLGDRSRLVPPRKDDPNSKK